jgi:hypothetical protein
MNDVMLMVRAVEINPDDQASVAALTDAIMEQENCERHQANAEVKTILATVRAGRDVANAAQLVARDYPARSTIVGELCGACGTIEDTPVIVIVVPGHGRAVRSYHGGRMVGDTDQPVCIMVGAIALLDLAFALGFKPPVLVGGGNWWDGLTRDGK